MALYFLETNGDHMHISIQQSLLGVKHLYLPNKTYYRVFTDMSNTTGGTCGAGYDFLSGGDLPQFLVGFVLLSVLCSVLFSIICLFLF